MRNQNFSEGKFLVYTVLAIVFLMGLHILQPQLHSIYNPVNYVGIHTILEVFSISISAAIFFYGLKAYVLTKSGRMLLLSFTFITIGILDLLHTVSFKGMPFFLTESSVAKATWFWVIARSLNAVLLLSILIMPDRKVKRDYRLLTLISGFSLTALIGFVIYFYEKSLPLLMIEGTGTTVLKNIMEYAVSLLLFISLLIVLYQYHMEKETAKLAVALGLVFMLLMELVFTVYQNIYDLDNFSGHVFKVFGFYFIFKGFYHPVVTQGKTEVARHESLNELPGFVFKAEKKGDDFICIFGEGNLLDEIGLTREEILGKSLAKVFTTNTIPFHEYCRLASRLRENIAFEMHYMDRLLAVSIKSYSGAEGHEALLGTVIDLTGIHNEFQFNRKVKKEFQAVM